MLILLNSNMWVPGIELQSSSLVADTLTLLKLLYKPFFLFFFISALPEIMYVHMCAWHPWRSEKDSRSHWSYWCLWAVIWVQRTESKSTARVVCALSLSISLVPLLYKSLITSSYTTYSDHCILPPRLVNILMTGLIRQHFLFKFYSLISRYWSSAQGSYLIIKFFTSGLCWLVLC